MALQYSCLGNPMERGAWQAVAHGVAGIGHSWETRPPPPPPSTAACDHPIHLPHPLLRQDALNSWLDISQGLSSTSAEQNQAIQHFWTNLIYFFVVCSLVKDEDPIRSRGSSWHCLGVLQCLSGTLSFMARLWKLEKSAISPRRLVLMDWGAECCLSSLLLDKCPGVGSSLPVAPWWLWFCKGLDLAKIQPKVGHKERAQLVLKHLH